MCSSCNMHSGRSQRCPVCVVFPTTYPALIPAGSSASIRRLQPVVIYHPVTPHKSPTLSAKCRLSHSDRCCWMTAGLYAFLSRGGGNSGRGPAETSGHQKKRKKQQNINTIKKCQTHIVIKLLFGV